MVATNRSMCAHFRHAVLSLEIDVSEVFVHITGVPFRLLRLMYEKYVCTFQVCHFLSLGSVYQKYVHIQVCHLVS
jgi:hypothetical protein